MYNVESNLTRSEAIDSICINKSCSISDGDSSGGYRNIGVIFYCGDISNSVSNRCESDCTTGVAVGIDGISF